MTYHRYQVRPVSNDGTILVLCKFWMTDDNIKRAEGCTWYAFLNDSQRRKLKQWCQYYSKECGDYEQYGSWVRVVPSLSAEKRLLARGTHAKEGT